MDVSFYFKKKLLWWYSSTYHVPVHMLNTSKQLKLGTTVTATGHKPTHTIQITLHKKNKSKHNNKAAY